MVLVTRADLKLSKGKLAAQCGHAVMECALRAKKESPLSHDEAAVSAALTISAMMAAKPVPFLQAMRKTVIDGSNTSGFQRTTLIATDGKIQTDLGAVGVDVICLEEDSARQVAE